METTKTIETTKTTETLEEQFIKHNLLIHKNLKKEYYKGIAWISFSLLSSMGLSYYFLWKYSNLCLIICVLIAIGSLFYHAYGKYITDKRNNELVRLDRDYDQAQECQKLEKNHPGGELSYDSLWSYSFYW